MKFNLIINIGDIIHQTKDNIIFTVVDKQRNNFTLQFYDKSTNNIKTIETTRKELKIQFETRSDYLTLIRVVK